ncbi:4Fe-4S dicluster domain-containing protein [Slackia exigua]|uniref:Dimethylsulfoxide reductase, chain B n=1 Tax=Slackia exigua (strain ATCC 700122 / DSM 15923 / CIP 105133 / JCM 11022 / KCTC 5966 / S-7) TaxID=649764 RepID=D0WG78_SLAES|nr:MULTISPECIES: 4Fe-4S dicluster domain-containing protein [Slackia]MDU6010729.1 4Fe-4S dicluster domain-containing protein [Slackia sp.]EEZ61491.1 putative dimethylsulfoxide reductase, chain B [Slackia exigua ATCC 700122]EJU34785.1 putative dimethylsulfoxide reductase, chain B [Slackia sp. CM382]MCQ5090743.1 4Fe-4S dicluster domain-containing protein [Slackia exigua]MDK7723235.1 4Fe-4S dicluster domain-containing protein [Slackia exigua]
MTQYGFYFDNARCTGCRTCEMACKDFKDLSETMAFRRIFDYEGGDWKDNGDGTLSTTSYAYHVSAACNHCANPACMEACPAGAIEKDSDTRLVFVNQDACKGFGACVDACPYGVPILSKEDNKAYKCDGCIDRVKEGKNPICVDACPLRALEFGPIDDLRAAHPDALDGIAPLPDPSQTTPSLAINASAAAKPVGDATGSVTNEPEVTYVEAREITMAMK